jgi:hypothetical protein
VVHLPDAERGYYQGTRFDWSGVIRSLEAGGHSYFGEWFAKHDPKVHDAITGPVEEFLSGNEALGYSRAAAGGTFIRIGVGALRKPEEPAFQRFKTYEIVNGGRWKVETAKSSVTFTHELHDASSGYGYVYQKAVKLLPGTAEMVLEHTLRNTGQHAIETEAYNHNFFVIDGQTTGPDFQIELPFAPKAARDLRGLAAIEGGRIGYLKPFGATDRVMTELTGFGGAASDHRIVVTNRKTGAAVEITGDQPLSKMVFWSAEKVLSPENYVKMSIAPGASHSWRLRYRFYAAPGEGK